MQKVKGAWFLGAIVDNMGIVVVKYVYDARGPQAEKTRLGVHVHGEIIRC